MHKETPSPLDLLEVAAGIDANGAARWADLARALALISPRYGAKAIAQAKAAGLDPFAVGQLYFPSDPGDSPMLFFKPAPGGRAFYASAFGVVCRR